MKDLDLDCGCLKNALQNAMTWYKPRKLKHAKWYVVQTKPQRESAVVARLEGIGWECFLPKIQAFKKIQPLFPNYFFINEDLARPDCYHMLKYTRGVRRVLGNNAGPIPIQEEAIQIIKGRIDSKSGCVRLEVGLKPGQTYRICHGPFKNLDGILYRVYPDRYRVQVLLNLMHQTVRVEVGTESVVPA